MQVAARHAHFGVQDAEAGRAVQARFQTVDRDQAVAGIAGLDQVGAGEGHVRTVAADIKPRDQAQAGRAVGIYAGAGLVEADDELAGPQAAGAFQRIVVIVVGIGQAAGSRADKAGRAHRGARHRLAHGGHHLEHAFRRVGQHLLIGRAEVRGATGVDEGVLDAGVLAQRGVDGRIGRRLSPVQAQLRRCLGLNGECHRAVGRIGLPGDGEQERRGDRDRAARTIIAQIGRLDHREYLTAGRGR